MHIYFQQNCLYQLHFTSSQCRLKREFEPPTSEVGGGYVTTVSRRHPGVIVQTVSLFFMKYSSKRTVSRWLVDGTPTSRVKKLKPSTINRQRVKGLYDRFLIAFGVGLR